MYTTDQFPPCLTPSPGFACPARATDLVNIFEVFLPQLLRYEYSHSTLRIKSTHPPLPCRYPNPSDPLNGEAAALLMRDPDAYAMSIRGACLPSLCLPVRSPSPSVPAPSEHVRKYASAKIDLESRASESSSSSSRQSQDNRGAASEDVCGTSPGGVEQVGTSGQLLIRTPDANPGA